MNYNVYRKILPNKMKVLMIPMNNTETIAVGMFIKVGSRYENKNNNGIAHFLEHMMFKGTTHMNTTTIANKLDSVGARYNAETSYEQTSYYIYGHKDDSNLFIKIITDIYLNPKFPKEDIETEKGVVTEELNMTVDEPGEQLHELMFSNIFNNSSLGYPIIGTRQNILNYTRNDIIDFRKTFYIPERTVFVVVGNFNKNKTLKLIKGIFKKKGNKKDKEITFPYNEPSIKSQPLFKIKKAKISQTSLTIAFKSQSIFSEREEIYDLISDILTSGTSSRLFVLLRNKLGAIYYCSAYNMSFTKEGVFIINIGVDNNRIDEVIKKVLEDLDYLRHNGVTTEELQKAKKMRITSFLVGLSAPQDILSYYGNNEITYRTDNTEDNLYFKHNMSINDHIKNYEKITLNDVNEVIIELFRKENLNIFIYGKQPKKMLK
jgi:zinc protease